MSEELKQKGLIKNGLQIGNYEFYNIGNTNLNQLKKYKIVPDKDYKEYGIRRPDSILVDRRNRNSVKVICVIEHKDNGKFKSTKDKIDTVQQCNDLCQVLNTEIGIATDDNSSFIWFNPNHSSPKNEYLDRTTSINRSFSIIKNESGEDFVKEFVIDQKNDEYDLTKVNFKTRLTIQTIELVRNSISSTNSQLIKVTTVNPTELAKKIWQDVWSVTGATPEKCLYTFVELFIFKYLSDLNILTEDDKGNKISFKDIYSVKPEKAFKNYTQNVREYLKIMFPPDPKDGTTIINGTILNPSVTEHSKVFHKILKKFNDFGELKNISPNFKSKVFEEFMKETISKKNWGQFFTPRNVINAIIEIDRLEEGSKICDPACGVGGFILEPIKLKDSGVNFYYNIEGNEIKPRYNFYGLDKGFEKEEQLTIILAKANMLIFISELLKKNPTLLNEFSNLFNSTFKLLSNSILGTLAKIQPDTYDLIMTNPPYVTSGSSNYKQAIKNDSELNNFYNISSLGIEGLFLQWVIKSLKPSKKAFVIIPDGILNRLNDDKLREFVRNECIIDGIISLPVNAFYRNPKKTYILAITKKPEKSSIERKEHIQTERVFTYLVSNIGETLDVKRFSTDKNDLIEMVSLFNQFKGAKKSFVTESKRCKIHQIDMFNPNNHWSIDRWWTKDEKIELGIWEEASEISKEDFIDLLKSRNKELTNLINKADSIWNKDIPETRKIRTISLADQNYFNLSIGKRVTKKDLHNDSRYSVEQDSNHKIPIYSANVFKVFGYTIDSNLKDFSHSYVMWGIDGTFDLNLMSKAHSQPESIEHIIRCGFLI